MRTSEPREFSLAALSQQRVRDCLARLTRRQLRRLPSRINRQNPLNTDDSALNMLAMVNRHLDAARKSLR